MKRLIEYRKLQLIRAVNRVCCICGFKIRHGSFYHDGGPGRRADTDCAKLAASLETS